MTLHPIPSEFPYNEENFVFFFYQCININHVESASLPSSGGASIFAFFSLARLLSACSCTAKDLLNNHVTNRRTEECMWNSRYYVERVVLNGQHEKNCADIRFLWRVFIMNS
jgi:hypothetical protein